MTPRATARLVALAVGLVAAAAAALSLAPAAAAHPLGNFTVNAYSGLRIQPDAVVVDHVLDYAEIPAFQARTQELDADRDGAVTRSEEDGWRVARCAAVAGGVRLAVDGVPAAFTVTASTLSFPPGSAGLPTLRLGCTLRAPADLSRPRHVSYVDGVLADRVGWREVTTVGDRTTLTASTVPSVSPSGRLTAYPEDLLRAPLAVRGAEVDARPGGPRNGGTAIAAGPDRPLPRGVDRATSAFTDLIGRQRLTVAFGLAALMLSVVLGALHALAPGHGKTVMAAFLVGGRGTLRQALTIGLTVTATHTVGVLVLGAVLTTSVALAPQRVYPWLGLASGVLLAGVGVVLLRRVRAGGDLAHRHSHEHDHAHGHSHGHDHAHGHDRAHGRSHGHDHAHGSSHGHARAYDRSLVGVGAGGHTHPHRGHDHDHPHAGDHDHPHADDHAHPLPDDGHGHGDPAHPDSDHGHGHGDPTHDHLHGDHTHPALAAAPLRRRALLAMGFAGGLVPSPSALVVLLGAVALGRTWFGILLVVGYGVGMAAALMGIGLLLARGGRLLERRVLSPRVRAATRRLPGLTALLIVVVGTGLAVQAAVALAAG